jgi:opacity protein-like surface antigen
MRNGVGWALLAGASAICAAHTAAAQSATQSATEGNWYVEGSAGALFRMDASRNVTFTNVNTGVTTPGTSNLTFSPGFVGNLGLGYRLPFGVRIEAELGYAHYSANAAYPVTPGAALFNGRGLGVQSGGNFDQGTATANAFYDVPIPGRVTPYIGGGFGAALTGYQGSVFSSTTGTSTTGLTSPGSTIVYPVILGELGLNIAVAANWTVVPSYRFEHVFTPSGAFTNNQNIFKLGVRYSW